MTAASSRDLMAKALKRRAELVAEVEALDRFVQDYAIAAKIDVDPEDAQQSLFGPPGERAAHAERLSEMLDAARRVLVAEQRPMKRSELRSRVEAMGFPVLGADKNKVFGTNLWRSKRFRTIAGRGYWPVDEPLPKSRMLDL